MSLNMNTFSLIGNVARMNLVKDAEGKVSGLWMTLGYNSVPYKDTQGNKIVPRPHFFSVWFKGAAGEQHAKYVVKGQQVQVSGTLAMTAGNVEKKEYPRLILNGTTCGYGLRPAGAEASAASTEEAPITDEDIADLV